MLCLQVMIHSRGLEPSIAESFFVAPGTEIQASITQTEVLMLPKVMRCLTYN